MSPKDAGSARERSGDSLPVSCLRADLTREWDVERPFLPAEVRQIFAKNGLRMVHHELYWGGLGALSETAYRAFMEPLQRQWRLGHGFARRQLVVATPV